MIGVNIGVPVPRDPFAFGGWNAVEIRRRRHHRQGRHRLLDEDQKDHGEMGRDGGPQLDELR